mgnify:CR=1 FL=1
MTHKTQDIRGLFFPMSLLLLVVFAMCFSASKTPVLFSWNGIGSQVEKVTKYIDRHDRQYWTEWHQWLLDNGSEAEFYSLKEYPNSYIKLIAHLGLMQKHPEEAFEVAKEAILIDDVLYPGTIHDCMGVSPQPMGAYLYECLFGKTFSGPHPEFDESLINRFSSQEQEALKQVYSNRYKGTNPYALWRERIENK